MNKQETDTAANVAQQSDPRFVLQRIYIRDLSFESPRPAEFFRGQHEPPEINLQLNNETQKLPGDMYEVTLKISVTAKPKKSETFMYRVEVKQAGLFTLGNLTEQEIVQMINIYCLSILFPYAREAISGLVERGGFPQLLLAPINFEALYQEHLNRLEMTKSASIEAKH